MRKYIILILVCIALTNTASAIEEVLHNFNTIYNTSGTRLDACELCHITDNIKEYNQFINSLNPYGIDIENNSDKVQTLERIENLDSDNDGFTNIEEIRNLTFPGDQKDPNKSIIDKISTAAIALIKNITSFLRD
jgi:hypothetical protein